MKLLYAIIFAIILSACHSGKVCNVPELIRMKKASQTRMKSSKRELHARASEKKITPSENKKTHQGGYTHEYTREQKKSVDAQEWDCPQPGTSAHDRMIRKQSKKKEKMHEETLRKQNNKSDEKWLGPYRSAEEKE